MKKIYYCLIIILFCSMVVGAADFTPQGNINLRDYYNITGAPYINATIYYGNGSALTGITVTTTNSSTWWADVSGWVSGWFQKTGDNLDFNETKLNETIDNRVGTVNDSMKNYVDLQDIVFNTTMVNYIGTVNTSVTNTFGSYVALTNANFVTLTDNSMADTLHRHSELSASDGTPDRALIVDSIGRVGIGTTSPARKLHVVGNGTYSATFMDGNVGIGTTAPGAKLHIDGSNATVVARLWSGGADKYAYWSIGRSTDELVFGVVGATGQFFNDSVVGEGILKAQSSTSRVLIGAGSGDTTLAVKPPDLSDSLVVSGGVTITGNVGIGTTSPNAKLHVNGSAIINGTLIGLSNATDSTGAVTLSQLQEVNATANIAETDPFWTANQSSYSTTAEINALPVSTFTNDNGYYNSSDFVISDYYTKANINSFNYYNSTDFDYNDYLLTSQWNATNTSYYLASNPDSYTTNTGTVTSIETTAPISGGTITSTGTISLATATPNDGDTTHASTADQIYDWVIGFAYATTSYVNAQNSSVVNWVNDIFYTKTEVNAINVSMKNYADDTFLTALVEDTGPQLGGYLDTAGQNIGSTSDEIENVYVATNSRIYFGDGQETSIYYNSTALILG